MVIGPRVQNSIGAAIEGEGDYKGKESKLTFPCPSDTMVEACEEADKDGLHLVVVLKVDHSNSAGLWVDKSNLYTRLAYKLERIVCHLEYHCEVLYRWV